MTHEIAEVTSRVGVVADVRDPLAGEHVLANLEDALANTLRDPGIDAVSDDKRELSKLVQAWVAKIHRQKSHVSHSEFRNKRLARGNRNSAEIDPYELTIRVLKGHRDQIVGRAAYEFQDAAAFDFVQRHSQEVRDGGKSIRVRLRKETRRIQDFIVRRGGCVRDFHAVALDGRDSEAKPYAEAIKLADGPRSMNNYQRPK